MITLINAIETGKPAIPAQASAMGKIYPINIQLRGSPEAKSENFPMTNCKQMLLF